MLGGSDKGATGEKHSIKLTKEKKCQIEKNNKKRCSVTLWKPALLSFFSLYQGATILLGLEKVCRNSTFEMQHLKEAYHELKGDSHDKVASGYKEKAKVRVVFLSACRYDLCSPMKGSETRLVTWEKPLSIKLKVLC